LKVINPGHYWCVKVGHVANKNFQAVCQCDQLVAPAWPGVAGSY